MTETKLDLYRDKKSMYLILRVQVGTRATEIERDDSEWSAMTLARIEAFIKENERKP